MFTSDTRSFFEQEINDGGGQDIDNLLFVSRFGGLRSSPGRCDGLLLMV